MRIYRRELLQQLGATAAASAFLPALGKSPFPEGESSGRLVRLDRNESPYGPCEKAKAAFHDAVAEANRYPSNEVESLRAAVAALHGVKPDNITLGCGSTEVLRMTADAFLEPGRNLVIASPTFGFIADAARVAGAEVRSTLLTRDYAHHLDAMLERADAKTGLLYICNPNNPTGTLTPKPDLEAFLQKVPTGAAVVIDEAYHDYVAPSSAYASWAGRAAADPNLIVGRTFSKAYGLAGVRVGYAVSSADTAKRLAARRLPMDVNVVGVRVALAALADSAYVRKIATLNANARQEFVNQVNARMLRCLDSHTNFVLMRTGTSGKEAADLLRGKGVLASTDYPGFEKHIRVSLGLPGDMQTFWRVWDELMPHHPM